MSHSSTSVTKYPRVLLICNGPQSRTLNSGTTIRNLFCGWPPENLAQLYLGKGQPDEEMFGGWFEMDARCVPGDYYVRRLLGQHPFSWAPEIPGLPTQESEAQVNGVKRKIHFWARALNDFSPVLISSGARQWIRNYAPEIIYSLLGNVRLMKLAIGASQCAKCPIVPHFMDDWPSARFPAETYGRFPNWILNRHIHLVVSRSKFGLCIGEDMAKEFQARYGIAFYSFMNCVDERWFSESPGQTAGRTIVTYVGGLHLNRWRSLATIAKLVSEMGAEMRVFAPRGDIQSYSHVFNQIRNIHLGSLTPDQVVAELRQSSLVVHTESFEDAAIRFARFSVSTKIPQYMASGKPILAYGPDCLASIRLVERAKAGEVVGVQVEQRLRETLTRLVNNPSLRASLGRNGYEYARKNFSQEIVSEHFRSSLALAASNRSDPTS